MVTDGFLAPILESLGDTPDAVADTLRSAGVKGVRNTVRFLNPLVRFVQANITDGANLDVIKGDTLRVRFVSRIKEEAALPPAVRAFLDNFNRWLYPDLEMPSGKA